MNAAIKPADLVVVKDQPMVADLTLAGALGFDQPRMIRKLIRRNVDELTRYGEVCSTVEQTSQQGGRPGVSYLLNEAQALLVCIKSEASRAADVRQQVIEVFMAWRRGLLPGPVADADLERQRILLGIITEARLVHGKAFAAEIWERLGLPVPPKPLADPEPVACLRHLLAFETGKGNVRELLERFFMTGDWTIRDYLGKQVNVYPVDDGFRFAMIGEHIGAIFAGSRFVRPCEYLLRLPGAVSDSYARGIHRPNKAVFMPSAVLNL